MANKIDSQFDYPLLTGIHQPFGRYCDICKKNISDYLCTDSKRLPHDQTYLCEECFDSYNYVDGKKVGDFKAYHYYDRTRLL